MLTNRSLRSLRIPALAAATAVAFTPALAAAHSGGFAVEGCASCHKSGATAITLKASPANPAPGATVTLDVTIDAVNGSVGGLYLLGDGRGTLVNLDGQGTHLASSNGLVQNAPKQATSGKVRFQASWIAPKTPGGVVFKVWGVSANGDKASSGDGAGFTQLSFAYGCSGSMFYGDHDEDGYGDDASSLVDCVAPANTSPKGGDCDDNNANIHPGASELCNNRDDNCDGQVDENLVVGPQYEDADGDGHGALEGKVVMAKCPPSGYVPTRDDCNDKDPKIHAGAPETCNYIDDDCDGRVDEDARARCGVGMCSREADACGEGASCRPGDPQPEACNAVDDDCDGEVDEGADLCGPGAVCAQGSCVPSEGSSGAGGSGSGGGGSGETSGCGIGPLGGSSGASAFRLLALLSPLLALSRARRRRAG